MRDAVLGALGLTATLWYHHNGPDRTLAQPRAMTPLTPRAADRTTVYIVAGGNHVTIALDRVRPGPAELRDISVRWGIEFLTGPIGPNALPATRSSG